MLQRLFPQRRISLPAHQVGAPKRRLIRPNVLLGSYGLLHLLFPQRRFSLPAHQVDAPKRRLIRPNVLLRP